MEVLQNDRSSTSKLPPSLSSSTSSLRKSIIKISSKNERIDSEQIEKGSISSNGEKERIVPIFRSISHDVNDNINYHIRLPSYTQNLNYKSPFNRINFTVSPVNFSKAQSRINQKSSGHDRCYSPMSSGYNSFSSASSNLVSSPEIRLREIRRTSTTNRLHSEKQSQNNSFNHDAEESSSKKLTTRQKRYSLNENVLKEDVIKALDQVEKRMVFFREIAFELFDEKRKLLDALNKICSSCSLNTFSEVDLQDIRATTDYLLHRLNSVDIVIKPIRSSSQVEAFEKANQYIDRLNTILDKEGKIGAKKICLSYISSCSSDESTDANNEMLVVPIDERFQKMVIECALEDQKAIKKKLNSFLEKIERK